jgi:hypothetical protein
MLHVAPFLSGLAGSNKINPLFSVMFVVIPAPVRTLDRKSIKRTYL